MGSSQVEVVVEAEMFGKIKVWLVAHDKVFTNLTRFRRHLTDNANCPRCLEAEESILHALRDCSLARDVWLRMGKQNAFFVEQNPAAWIKDQASGNIREVAKFLCIMWHVWLARNVYIFNHMLLSSQNVISKGVTLGRYAHEAVGISSRDLSKDGVMFVHWRPPASGWVKLNVDGSLCQVTGNASTGGVVRGEASNWCVSFAANLGSHQALMRNCGHC